MEVSKSKYNLHHGINWPSESVNHMEYETLISKFYGAFVHLHNYIVTIRIVSGNLN